MRNINYSLIFAILIFAFAVFGGFIIYRAAWFGIDKHFSLLAQSFLKNNLFLEPNNLPDGDYVDWHGKQYLFFGPMPSILLIPPVLIFGKNFPQMTLSITSLIVIFITVYFLTRKLGFTKTDSLWLSNFFVFGTVLYFVSLVNTSAYIVQAVATAFFALALLEYFTKRRWLIIGVLIASAGMTRITLYGTAIFFLLELIRQRKLLKFRENLIYFLLPILISVLLLGTYNFRRFHSFFDTGYTHNISVLDKDYYNYKLGWFNPIHIPANLYALLLKPPQPIFKEFYEFVLEFPYLKAEKFGMAIWFTSPLFLYLIKAKKVNYTYSAVISVILIAIPSLTYFGIGAVQFGYRYSLDFLPLLFLILLTAFRGKLPTFAKILIAAGIIFNCFYMSSVWNSYPLLNFWEYLD